MFLIIVDKNKSHYNWSIINSLSVVDKVLIFLPKIQSQFKCAVEINHSVMEQINPLETVDEDVSDDDSDG